MKVCQFIKNAKLNELEKNSKVLNNLCKNCSSYLNLFDYDIPCKETHCPVYYSKFYSNDALKIHKELLDELI